MKTEFATITPAIAAGWLETCNTRNRSIRRAHVTRLARDMKDGKWVGDNGEAVRFDTHGRLVDGQHRLTACVESGTAITSLVVRDVPDSAYSTINIGRGKSVADFLHPEGHKNAIHLAATAKLVTMWMQDNLPYMRDGSKFPTTPEVLETLANNPGISDSVSFVVGISQLKRLLTPSFGSFLHYVATQTHNNALVSAFLERVANGLSMTPTDPAYQLRKVLLTRRGSQRKAGQVEILAILRLRTVDLHVGETFGQG